MPVLTDPMFDRISQRLSELGVTLPEPAAPVAAYVPAVEVNGLLHISGQLPFEEGRHAGFDARFPRGA